MALSKFVRELEEQNEAVRSGKQKTIVFDPRPHLTSKQVSALDDPARHRAWPAGRRSGKTHTAQCAVAESATKFPRTASVYLSTTISRAIDTVWDELKEINTDHDLGGKPNESIHQILFPNKSRIHVKGGETKKHIDRLRGIKRIHTVVIDEAQDWDDALLKYAIGSVILPSLADVQGRLIVCGSGGDPKSYWQTIVRDAVALGIGIGPDNWTLYDNPIIKDPAGEINTTCQFRGVGPDDPSIRREYFAEFIKNTTLQILHVSAKNLIPRSKVPTAGLHKVIAADFGTVDACAVVVLGWSDHDPHIYLLEVVKDVGLGASEQVRFVRSVINRHKQGLMGVVGDGGGLGKALVIDLQQTSKLYEVEPAEKANKVPAMRLLAGELRNGTILIPDDETSFLRDLERPEWDPDKAGERIKGHVPDPVDAFLYGYRQARQLFTYEPPKIFKKMTEEDRDMAELVRLRKIKPQDRNNIKSQFRRRAGEWRRW